jgi:REP element-mobilizing transposase RayT
VIIPADHPHFITITIYEWKHLLKPDKYKDLILESLRFLVREKRAIVYAFVIMSNHMHLIWQILEPFERSGVQRDFLKYVGQQIKFDLSKNHPNVLEHFKVDKKDRKYQFWKRNALSVDLFSDKVFDQKLQYIHDNPVKAGLCDHATDYMYSSARFYFLNEKTHDFLTNHEGD